MARVIRRCWVYKPLHKYKYYPRPNFGPKPYDYEEEGALPEFFPDRLPVAPKLWAAWIYQTLETVQRQPKWIQEDVKFLFGQDWQPGKMEVFKNTPSWNKILWRIKHLLEVKAVTFPHGEPTMDDVLHTEFDHEGVCVVDKKLAVESAMLEGQDKQYKNISEGFLQSLTARKWHQGREINEDDMWTDPNHSRVS